MENNTPISNLDNVYFKYTPLDYDQRSIRLIRLLPNTCPDGLLQCDIYEATVDDEYTCLSYVWGPEKLTHEIKIQGKLYSIRSNLYDFLRVSRTQYALQPLWIDALCIDQMNTFERNHQVRQMGEIYSKAKLVIAWLGNIPFTAAFLDAASRCANRTDEIRGWLPSSHENTNDSQALDDVLYHHYWTRAWIIQEILLPNKVKVQACDKAVDLSLLVETIRSKILDHPYSTPFGIFKDILIKKDNVRGLGLFQLLRHFKQSDSSIKRDRIFSLLGLCSEGAFIKVDYDMPEELLIYEVLRACQADLCFCTTAIIAHSLDCQFMGLEGLRSDYPVVELRVNSTEVQLGGSCHQCSQCGSWVEWNHMVFFCLESVCKGIGGHLFWNPGSLATWFQNTPQYCPTHGKRSLSSSQRYICLPENGMAATSGRDNNGYIIQITMEALIQIVLEKSVDVDCRSLEVCQNFNGCQDDKNSIPRLRLLSRGTELPT